MADSLPTSAECVIVGGGAVGCSLAYHLAMRGLKPLLIERGQLGAGSTGRCAGGIRQQFSTPVNVKVGMLSRRLLERFPEEIGQSADFRQIGYLFLGSNPEQAEQFARNVAMQQSVGLDDVRLLSADDASDLVPGLRTDDLTAATFCPSDGLAGPNEVTAGYAAAARRAGAQIVEGVAVEAIETVAGQVVGATVSGQRIATSMVVDCAGPHAAEIGAMAGVDVPVRPFRRHIFVTERFSLDMALRADPSLDIPMTVDFATSFYFHPEGDGLLLGMSDPDEPSSFDTSVVWNFLEQLVAKATHRLPALEHASIRTGWAGLYEVSPDHQAIVGESHALHGFWLCCGFSGHGFMQAPAIGLLLADAMTGKIPEIDLAPYAPDRFVRGESYPEAAVI